MVGRAIRSAKSDCRSARSEFQWGFAARRCTVSVGAVGLQADRSATTARLEAGDLRWHSSRFLDFTLPILGGVADSEFDAHLALDISLLDPQGQPVWTRHYDDGLQVWKHDWTEQAQAPEALMRMTHEAAWRLSQRAVQDLGAWVRAERMRPRSL